VERLAQALSGGSLDDAMTAELVVWLAGSPRFRVFAEAHVDKIRKKFRGATDPESMRDVRAELRTARLLLGDRRIDVAFEAYGSGKAGPDFTVAFRGARSFNIEVTRPHRVPDTTSGLALSVLAKLRQLPPSTPNAILFAVDADTATALDVDGAARMLRSRADVRDDEFFTDRGFDGPRGFYERYLRLGAVIVSVESAEGDGRAAMWVNRSARIAMPDAAARACLHSLRADIESVAHIDSAR
jgi:hypothetical protein